MQRLYSPTTGTTYFTGFNTDIPVDAVEISEAVYREVLADPAPGKVRSHDAQGQPVLIDPPAMTPEQHANAERQWRNRELEAIKWLRERHRDQLDIEAKTSLSAEQFRELLEYIQSLRDWPQCPDFSNSGLRPVQPGWITEQRQ